MAVLTKEVFMLLRPWTGKNTLSSFTNYVYYFNLPLKKSIVAIYSDFTRAIKVQIHNLSIFSNMALADDKDLYVTETRLVASFLG